MATRATYQVNKTVFYCHWDGYPAGAALRFAKMIEADKVPSKTKPIGFDLWEDRRGGWEFAFIRGNLDAEPTGGHDEHGDTEFRYSVFEKDGKAFIRVDSRRADWGGFHKGEPQPLAAWINRELKAKGWEGCPEIVEVNLDDGYGYKRTYLATAEAAKGIAENAAEESTRYGESNPNKAVYARQAQQWGAAQVAA